MTSSEPVAAQPMLFAFDRQARLKHAPTDAVASAVQPDTRGVQDEAKTLALEMLAGLQDDYVESRVNGLWIEAYRLGAYGILICVLAGDGRRHQRQHLLEKGFSALTGRQVDFLSYQRLVKDVPETSPLITGSAAVAADLQPLRTQFARALAELPLQLSRRQRLQALLVLSELATNTIQHGHRGELKVYRRDSTLTLFARDRGPGMRSRDLPFLLFRKGYSSVEGNMGLGYPVIIELAERVLLSTGPAGTYCLVRLDPTRPPEVTRGPRSADDD